MEEKKKGSTDKASAIWSTIVCILMFLSNNVRYWRIIQALAASLASPNVNVIINGFFFNFIINALAI